MPSLIRPFPANTSPTFYSSASIRPRNRVAAYDQAKRLYERLVLNGQEQLEADLAALCRCKASVHEASDDFPGALAEYDQAIAIGARLVNQQGHCELASNLVMARSEEHTSELQS